MILGLGFLICAALGAIARAEAGRRWNRHQGFPVGTLAVNVTGAFLLGLVSDASPALVTIVGVGGLGAFTTFSSFARDGVALVELRRLVLAGTYLVGTCVLSVGAVALGTLAVNG